MRVSNLMGVSNLRGVPNHHFLTLVFFKKSQSQKMVVYEGFGAPIDFETHIQANFVFIWLCMHRYIKY